MTTELGVLKINGEVRALEARGGDPFGQLVMPRVLGTAVSAFCLTIVFILVAFASGFLFAAWTGQGSRDLFLFADTVSRAVQPKETFSTSLPKAFCPPCLPAHHVVLAGWVSARRSRKSRTPPNGRSPAPSPGCLSSPPRSRC
jgi:ABC-type transporter Mla maintaining outer membrane lipid asymmetry permease subunit MlaE